MGGHEGETEAERLERKRLKKEKKREKKRQAREEEEEEEGGVAVAAAGGGKRKAEAEPAAEPEEEKKASKKSKKESKKEGGGGGAGAAATTATGTTASAKEIEAFRAEANIEVFPSEDAATYPPFLHFSNLLDKLKPSQTVKDTISGYVTSKNFKAPSPIQAQCWPPLLQNRDVIGIAATGSGKTLTFLVPALLKIALAGPFKQKPGGTPSPRVLVMAPTRELAMQSQFVCDEVKSYRSVCIYGGVPKQHQRAELKAGAEIVVATPGRLLDLVEEGALSMQGVLYLVLDEADRMLDEGFEPAIRKIISTCPTSDTRQTVMFSATWPEEIRRLARTFLKPEIVRITVGGQDLAANHRVKQIVECIEKFKRDKRLIELLQNYHKSRTNRCLIFVLYKKEATTVQQLLQSRGFAAVSIHGDLSQPQRTEALDSFKRGTVPLLIATDVAARGLDIPQVEYVLNYSFPLSVEDYVHRIGRTGRGGASGISHTFFTDDDKGLAGGLVGVLQEAKQEVPEAIMKYPLLTKKKTSNLYGDFGPKEDLVGKTSTKIVFDD